MKKKICIFFQSTHQVGMKNVVKCYKHFFGYFNALETHSVQLVAVCLLHTPLFTSFYYARNSFFGGKALSYNFLWKVTWHHRLKEFIILAPMHLILNNCIYMIGCSPVLLYVVKNLKKLLKVDCVLRHLSCHRTTMYSNNCPNRHTCYCTITTVGTYW